MSTPFHYSDQVRKSSTLVKDTSCNIPSVLCESSLIVSSSSYAACVQAKHFFIPGHPNGEVCRERRGLSVRVLPWTLPVESQMKIRHESKFWRKKRFCTIVKSIVEYSFSLVDFIKRSKMKDLFSVENSWTIYLLGLSLKILILISGQRPSSPPSMTATFSS